MARCNANRDNFQNQTISLLPLPRLFVVQCMLCIYNIDVDIVDVVVIWYAIEKRDIENSR